MVTAARSYLPALDKQAREHLHRLAGQARRRMDRLADRDAASQDVLVEVVRVLEEQLWMVRSQLGWGLA
jgi:DNA-binding ferritin-like protein